MLIYGARDCGSAITEGMLALSGYRYEFIDVAGFDKPGPARDRLRAITLSIRFLRSCLTMAPS